MSTKAELEQAYREQGWGEAAAELAELALNPPKPGASAPLPVTVTLTSDQARAVLSYVRSAASGLRGADQLRVSMGREPRHQGRIEMLQGIVGQLQGPTGRKGAV